VQLSPRTARAGQAGERVSVVPCSLEEGSAVMFAPDDAFLTTILRLLRATTLQCGSSQIAGYELIKDLPLDLPGALVAGNRRKFSNTVLENLKCTRE
jgi:hypothetical protein